MNEPSRRSFLSGSLVTIAGLAGYNVHETAAARQTAPTAALDDDVRTAFDLVPTESAVDADYRTIVLADVTEATATEDLTYQTRSVVDGIDALEAADVSHIALARAAESGQFGSAVGSFDQLETGETLETDGDWRLAETGTVALASADSQIAFARGDRDTRQAAVESAVAAARDETDSVIDASDRTTDAFDRLGSKRLVIFLPTGDEAPAPVPETVDALAAGFQQPPTNIDGTVENEYLLYGTENLKTDRVRRVVRRLEPVQVADLTLDRQDGVVHATVQAEEPPERDRDAAPDARLETERTETGLSVTHEEGESIPAEDLEVWVDGTRAATQPADEFEVFGSGDTLTVETDSLATVTVRWFDENEDVYYEYVQRLLGADAFETAYGVEANRLTITYTGDRPADPSKVTLRHASDTGSESTTDSFADVSGELTAGDSVTVPDVTTGDRISLRLDVPARPRGTQTTLVQFHARPPRAHVFQHDDSMVVAYHDDTERDAEDFRILVDGEPAERQFSDDYSTLQGGDRLRIGEPAFGSTVTVEWTAPSEPVEIAQRSVVPRGEIQLRDMRADGQVELHYHEGDAIPADELALRVNDAPASVQPAEEYEQFEPGDSLTLEVPPFSVVELVWTGGRDDDHRVDGAVIGRNAIEARYDPDQELIELVYVGDRPADPSRIDIRRGFRHPDQPQDGPTAFEQSHETLTSGDSIRVENVDADERFQVVLTTDGDYYRPVLRFTPRPRWAFSFADRDGTLAATYQDEVVRDASSFRILVDGEPNTVQPADEYDRLDDGDELKLGSFPAGTEITVEWVVPDDPVEVRSHIVTPDADFTFDYDADAETVTIEHAGGETVAADSLAVMVHSSRSRRRPDAWGDAYTEVSEGDAITLDLSSDDPSGRFYVVVFFEDSRMLDYAKFQHGEGGE